jgi:hypothetical protein
MIDMRRSFFRIRPDSKKYFMQWIYDACRQLVPLLDRSGGIAHRVCSAVHRRHQTRCLQAYRHQLDVGYRVH